MAFQKIVLISEKMQWQALQTKMEQMGIKKLDYASETYALITATQEYALLNQSSLLRENLASQLMQNRDR